MAHDLGQHGLVHTGFGLCRSKRVPQRVRGTRLDAGTLAPPFETLPEDTGRVWLAGFVQEDMPPPGVLADLSVNDLKCFRDKRPPQAPSRQLRSEAGWSQAGGQGTVLLDADAWINHTPAMSAFAYTYVLKLSDGEWYVGSTDNLKRRLKEHEDGECDSTKHRRPVELVYFEGCRSLEAALAREKQLKTGYGRGYLRKRLAHELGGN